MTTEQLSQVIFAAGLAQASILVVSAQVPAARLSVHPDIATAMAEARAGVPPDGRVLVLGSFHTAAEALRQALV